MAYQINVEAIEKLAVAQCHGTWSMMDIVNRASKQIDDWGHPDDWKNKDVILDIIRAAIMRHCGLSYPEYSLAPWHRVAKYLARSSNPLAIDLELLDPDFDDMQ